MESKFCNPVYPRNFPDPFVLKYRGEYWAYGTGAWRDGRWFGILRSRDLATWEDVGGAVEPLPGEWPCVWAPEVSYHNGTFYLYYSIGDEATMQLRVATASSPAGPFVDSGRRLTHEEFAIDAHVFVDDDGARYLFYATDYLEHSHVGTGTARVALADYLTPAGAPSPVTRARYDWQVYDPQRAEKGGARWHTIEGPFVLKRKGLYYQMFSGGNWQNLSYGVSYAISARIDTPEEWSQVADGERVIPILRTLPGLVIGPGHNSAVRGPNNQELFCVYHRWADDQSGRVLALDRLDWAGERMLLLGPTTTPQPVYPPSFADFFDDGSQDEAKPLRQGGLGPGWTCAGGDWSAGGGAASQRSDEPAEAVCAYVAQHFVAEVSVRATNVGADGVYGVALGDRARFLIKPARGLVLTQFHTGDGWETNYLRLPADFAPAAYHLLRVELNAGYLTVQLDEASARWEIALNYVAPLPLALVTDGAAAEFAGFALTEGWADLFYPSEDLPASWGWHGGAGWRVAGGELLTDGGAAPLLKGPVPRAYELTLNARLDDRTGGYGFYPVAREGDLGPLVALVRTDEGWALTAHVGEARHSFALPASFDPTSFQQLRAVVRGGRVELSWEGLELGAFAAPQGATHVGIGADGPARFDLVRVIAISAT